jgi:hypothetical protein
MHTFLPSYYQHWMNAAVNFMPQLLHPQEKRFIISGLEAATFHMWWARDA